MIHEMDVALYILSLDKNHELFTKKLHTQHGRTFYEGNVRLNEYLHLAQNIHIAPGQYPNGKEADAERRNLRSKE